MLLPKEPKKPAKKPKGPPPERPESMKSDNPDKDMLLEKLWGMMALNAVLDPMLIQVVCAKKGYYDVKTPVNEYEIDFIDGCLIEAWDKVFELVKEEMEALPF